MEFCLSKEKAIFILSSQGENFEGAPSSRRKGATEAMAHSSGSVVKVIILTVTIFSHLLFVKVYDVLACAIEYGLDELRRVCVGYLAESLSVNSCCEAMQAAVTYGQEDLQVKALAFIEKQTQVRPPFLTQFLCKFAQNKA